MASKSLAQIAEHVLEELEALVGCPAEGVTAISHDGDEWVVTVEILELERVPETTDVMSSYEVRVDGDGEITGYRRVSRYLRAHVDTR